MTRRIRFTPLLAAGLFAAVTGSAPPAAAVEVPFVAQPTVGAGGLIRQAVADVDRDGDTDVVQIDEGADRVTWLENVGGTGATWTLRTISTAVDGPRGVAVADFDRDGDVDVGVASVFDSRITWFENVGNGTPWTFRTVSTAAPSARTLAAADVDGDGDTDLAYATGLASPGIDFVTWFENSSAGSVWTAHTVATTPVVPYTVSAADVDGDGDQDLFSQRSWHENLAGNGSAWATHSLPRPAFQHQPVDIDRDGDVDLLQGAVNLPTTLAWLENTAGNGSAWTIRTLGIFMDDTIHSVAARDVDGDGDPDVVYTMGFSYAHRVRWFENTGGTGAAWILRTLTTSLTTPRAAQLTDLDGDGDTDVAIAAGNAGLAWFRNETLHESACFAPQRIISTAVTGVTDAVPSDVDGDGDTDVVSSAYCCNQVAWHENVGGAAVSWTVHTIVSPFNQPIRAAAGDVDRDGDVDVAVVSGTQVPVAGLLRWFENTAGNGSAWLGHFVAAGIEGMHALGMADLSGDGDLDLVVGGLFGAPTRWFENAANGTAWTPGVLPPVGQAALVAADLDRDGDYDVASAAYPGAGTGWSENTAGNGSAWSFHTIGTAPTFTSTMQAVDVDGDGDPDVMQPTSRNRWHENVGGAGGSWTTHTIVGAVKSFLSDVGDLDRDGDPDVMFGGGAGNIGITWWENSAGDGSAWSGHAVTTSIETTEGLAVSDLDGDGDADAVSATPTSNTLAWHENRSGQGSIAVESQAPATANNSEVVSMLRATVTHLGRPGDGPLELASLSLRFEEFLSDPLTTTEANALVESLRIYRDANGNGVFEPATDVLVTTIGTLALTAGLQAVPFADGDANVQVTLGTPRDYFVVVELTANASGQVPNQLMVTLLQLGALASRLEDATFDIPLRLACPADVASAIKQAVPVELIGFRVE